MKGERLHEVRIPGRLVAVDTDTMESDLRANIIQWLDQNNINWELDFYFNPTTTDVSSDDWTAYNIVSKRMGYQIQFTNEKDALLFTLRWL